jgi:threonine/homoserine/homoserine lactone efflux protein
MGAVSELLTTGLLGLLAGFITSALGGPINVTVVNESAQHGFRRAFIMAIGAVLMETIYCVIAFAGFAQLFQIRLVRAAMELFSFLLVLWLGIKYLRAGHIPGEERVEQFVERKLHPHTAFWTGFVRVLGNPGVLLLWIGITGSLLAHNAMEPTWTSKGAFCAGVAASGLGWFAGVSWGVSHGHGKFSKTALRRLSQASGVLLLITACIIAGRLVMMLARLKHGPAAG